MNTFEEHLWMTAFDNSCPERFPVIPMKTLVLHLPLVTLQRGGLQLFLSGNFVKFFRTTIFQNMAAP